MGLPDVGRSQSSGLFWAHTWISNKPDAPIRSACLFCCNWRSSLFFKDSCSSVKGSSFCMARYINEMGLSYSVCNFFRSAGGSTWLHSSYLLEGSCILQVSLSVKLFLRLGVAKSTTLPFVSSLEGSCALQVNLSTEFFLDLRFRNILVFVNCLMRDIIWIKSYSYFKLKASFDSDSTWSAKLSPLESIVCV